MTVYRRMFKVKTVGSRLNGDLRPEFSDEFIQRYGAGINFVVHEYNEKEGWCVIECWCTDHSVLEDKYRKTDVDLKVIDKDVISVLTEHTLSPNILGTLSAIWHDSVDEAKKEITVKGRKGKFLRKDKVKSTAGKEEDCYVLDEG